MRVEGVRSVTAVIIQASYALLSSAIKLTLHNCPKYHRENYSRQNIIARGLIKSRRLFVMIYCSGNRFPASGDDIPTLIALISRCYQATVGPMELVVSKGGSPVLPKEDGPWIRAESPRALYWTGDPSPWKCGGYALQTGLSIASWSLMTTGLSRRDFIKYECYHSSNASLLPPLISRSTFQTLPRSSQRLQSWM